MMSASLIGIIGPFGPAQLACLRSWRRAGYRTAFFQLGGRRLPAKLQGMADVYRFYPVTSTLGDILGEVSNECSRLAVAGLAALSESLALQLHAQQGAGGFTNTRLLLNIPAVYELLESKLRQAEIAALAGLPVMPTLALGRNSSVTVTEDGALVLRPDVAKLVRPAFKAHLVKSGREAAEFVQGLKSESGKIIAQPLVTGPNLIIHAARASDGAWDHHEGYVTEIKSGGLAVSLRPYAVAPQLLQACRNFEREVGLQGVFHYDFILNRGSGEAFFLEVNPRLGGTTAKVYAAGYDEPAMLVAAFLESGMPQIELRNPRSPSISRIAALRYASSMLVRRPSVLDHPCSARHKSIGQLAKALACYPDEVFSLTDLVGNLAYLMQAKS